MELPETIGSVGGVPDDAPMRERKQRIMVKFPPSHPSFDRSRFTDAEYIELLLFEIKELQSTIDNKDARILALEGTLKAKEVLGPLETPVAKRIVSENHADDEIPQRSARRRRNSLPEKADEESSNGQEQEQEQERRGSVASITSNGPIAIDGGVPLSLTFRSELSAAAALSATSDRPFISENNSTSTKYEAEEKVTTPRMDQSAFNKVNTLVATESPKSVINTIRRGGTNEQLEIQRSPVLLYDRKMSTTSTDSSDSALGKQRKNSTSSVNSYKSRIKLPSTLKQTQMKPDPISSPPDTSSEQQANFSDTRRSPTSPATTVISPSVVSSKDYHYDISDSVNDVIIPRTPEAFRENSGKLRINTDYINRSMEEQSPYFESPLNSATSYSNQNMTPKTNYNFDLKSPVMNGFASTDSFGSSQRPSSQSHGSSFQVLHTPKQEEEDVSLFIKPEEFQTIRINVVSTINVNSKRSDDPSCTFSINDKATNKEMWRIRKSYQQLVAFDAEVRPIVEFFGLPPLPEKLTFSATTPTKIDARKNILQEYFDTLFMMPHIPQMVLYRICRYLSLDFVNPLDDFKSGARKEGYLIRRYKGLGTTWKVRWCQVDGPSLEIYEFPGGPIIEQIKLTGSQIGRQSSDTVAEERGYRHAFLILESTKSSKLSSSYPKHFFCAESDEERDDWVGAMVEFTENDPLANLEKSTTSTEKLENGHGNHSHNDGDEDGRYEYQNEYGGDSRYLSGVPSTFGQKSAESDIQSNNTQEDIARELKEAKKLRKRSLFPFRHKNPHNGGENASSSRDKQLPSNPADEFVSPTNIQVYLDQMKLSDNVAKSIFGREVEVAFELSNHEYKGHYLPSICYRCLEFLNRTGAVYEEGIFRLSGSASTIRQLKDQFNTAFDIDLFDCSLKPDMHTVAGLFKTYLRELPSPIFGQRSYNQLQGILTSRGSHSSKASSALVIRDFLNNLNNIDQIHYDICYTIFKFLKTIIENSASNRMNLKNVCIVFVPTLNISLDVLSLCLVDFDCIFGNAPPVADEKREVLDLQIPTF